MYRLITLLTSALIIGSLLAGATLIAQGTRSGRVPVTITIADVDDGTPAFSVRRKGGRIPRDVIVLRADASAETLSEAVRTLMTARLVTGDTAVEDATIRVRSRAGAAPHPALPWAARVLNDLRAAERRAVPGVGVVRAVEIYLPRQPRARVHPVRNGLRPPA